MALATATGIRTRSSICSSLRGCFLVLPLLLFGLSALADEPDPLGPFFYNTFGDLSEDLENAYEEGKIGLLLFFEQPGCSYCERMRAGVFNDPVVQEWFKARFLAIAVNIRSEVELTDFDGITLPSREFAEHRRVYATPVLSFIAQDGTEVFRRSREITSSEELLLIGEYVASKAYYDTTFDAYATSRRSAGLTKAPDQ